MFSILVVFILWDNVYEVSGGGDCTECFFGSFRYKMDVIEFANSINTTALTCESAFCEHPYIISILRYYTTQDCYDTTIINMQKLVSACYRHDNKCCGDCLNLYDSRDPQCKDGYIYSYFDFIWNNICLAIGTFLVLYRIQTGEQLKLKLH